ncbi:nephrin isoform X3 [Tetranychus urticae]|uniref:nephrin isoform X3 n=1 Tax=Tetranychus urticae TaxID=32264 RepID=UPI00077BB137|nr:nephrin isoform X3 [Tetranychus urticae]
MGLIHSYTNSIPMEYVINLFILTNIFISLTSKVNSMDILNPNESNVRNKYSDSPHNRSIVSSTNQYHSQQQYFRVRPRSNVEVIEGSSIVLQCSVGNQAGPVQWAKDGFVLGFDRSIPGYPRYRMDGNPSEGVHNLKIERASIDDDGEYQCQVGPATNNKAIRANSRLTVLLKPKKIEINGHTNGSAVEIREGEKVTLTCLVYGGKPAAKIKWFRKDIELKTDNLPNQSVLTVTSSLNEGSSSDQITATKSQLLLNLHSEDNGVTYSCSASHPALSNPLRSTVSMSVLYPPGPPEILGYSTGKAVRSGDTLKLRCRSRGGNPLAQLVWYKDDEQVDFSFDSYAGRESVNEYIFTVKPEHNNAKLTCESKTPINPTPMTTSVTLSVQFAPSKVTIVGPDEAKAGDNVTMICKTDASNPPSELSWSIDGRTIRTENIYKSHSKGGYITTTNITLPILSTERSMKTFSCFAVNQALDKTVPASHALSILFKPEFISSEPLASFELVEGSEASINLTARGNPSNIKYKWHRINGNGELDATRFYTDGPILNITSVLRQDSGSYLIEASNSQGTTKLPFKLNIKYAATITKTSDLVLVEMGKTAYLECTVDANPITADLIKWQRKPNYIENSMDDSLESTFSSSTLPNEFISMDEERFKITLEENRSFLSVFNITESDSGAYECLASNGIGSPDKATTNLVVKHKPRIINSPILSKSASDNGSKGKLICRAQGAPNITFQWLREGAIISDKPGNTKYNTEPAEQLNLITYQSVLIINEVANSDYGPYDCVASNELGINRLTVHFNHTSQPDPPLVLKVVNRTSSSVTLKWIPGFDGGLPQSFRIRYQKVDATGSTTLPSPNPTSSASLPNTQSTPDASSSISTEPAQYSDVYPSNTTIYTIKGLTDNTEYSFNVMAYNDLGESKYTHDIVKGKTLQETPISETERISQVFSGRSGDVPRLIIIAVSILGSSLLLLNVVLVVCFVRKRRKKRLEEEADGSSTNKPTTIEMYAPASGSGGSYTNGPNETSLSGSDEEKHSEGAYSGHTDYDMEMNPGDTLNGNQQNIHPNIHSYMHGNIHQSLSTYLIDDTLDHVTSYYQPMFGQENKCINIPPVPPLRSINLASFLPMINEEPLFINSSPLGHLV